MTYGGNLDRAVASIVAEMRPYMHRTVLVDAYLNALIRAGELSEEQAMMAKRLLSMAGRQAGTA